MTDTELRASAQPAPLPTEPAANETPPVLSVRGRCPSYVEGKQGDTTGMDIRVRAPRACTTKALVLTLLNGHSDFVVEEDELVGLRANRQELWQLGYTELLISYANGVRVLVAIDPTARKPKEPKSRKAKKSKAGGPGVAESGVAESGVAEPKPAEPSEDDDFDDFDLS